MATEVIMPKLGMTMEEGTIISWFRDEGDQLSEGEPLFEVETDKVTTEVPAPASGVLRKVLAEPGATLLVGQAVAIIADADETIHNLSTHPTNSTETLTAPREREAWINEARGPEAETASDTYLRASPAARKLARDHGIDLTRIKGSGPTGRIIENDVLQAMGSLSSSVSSSSAVTTKADVGRHPRERKGS